MMSVHDALVAWQQGEITASRAIALCGTTNVLELYGLAEACGVEIKLDLTDRELRVASAVTDSVTRIIAKTEEPVIPSGKRAA